MSEQPKEPAWQTQDRLFAPITAQRKQLLANGYVPIPASGKRPTVNGWQEIRPIETDIDKWQQIYPTAQNTGILVRTSPAVDIDVLDAAVAEEMQDLLFSMIGDTGHTMVRVGKPPKRAILFQTDRPFAKKSTPIFFSPDQQNHKVEVLCDGQQIIVYGIHPDTGAAYSWKKGEPGEVARDALPYMDEILALKFVAAATALMRAKGWVSITEEKPAFTNGATATATVTAAAATADEIEFKRAYGTYSTNVVEREQAYARAALTNIKAQLARTMVGRNNALNDAAFKLGTLCGAGWISRDEVFHALTHAATINGYIAKDGEKAARDTIRSGLSAGEKCPHPPLPDRDRPGFNIAAPPPNSEGAAVAVDVPQPSTIPEPVGTTPQHNGATAEAGCGPPKEEWVTTLKAGPIPAWQIAGAVSPTAAVGDDVQQWTFFDVGDWKNVPIVQVRFLVNNRIPMLEVTLLTGDGAAGKTTIAVQLTVAVASRGGGHGIQFDWLGACIDERGPVLFVTAEERLPSMHRRIDAVLKHHNLDYDDVAGRIKLLCLPDEDASLASIQGGKFQATRLYQWLLKQALEIRPKLVVVEALVDVFDADEIKRRQVRQFVKLLSKLAIAVECAVLLIGHPSLAGMSSGSGLSGSTDWHNAVRARLYFTNPEKSDASNRDARELRVVKNNFGPNGEVVPLIWRNGVYIRPPSTSETERAAGEASVDAMFLQLLTDQAKRGIYFSANPNSKTYAPTKLAELPEAKTAGIRKFGFEAAMNRLFEKQRIEVKPQPGLPPSKAKERPAILVCEHPSAPLEGK